MGSVTEIRQAVRALGEEQFQAFAAWFEKHEEERWDRQLERDQKAGPLRDLMDRARADFAAGKGARLKGSVGCKSMTMRKIEVVDYDPSWPAQFAAECDAIRHVLGNVAMEVHHIGSTAVPGLAAKPIIDIVLEVSDLAALDAHNSQMEEIGYKPRGEFGIPGRRYFQKGGDNRTHHLHAFLRGDPNVVRHIAFRDYLRRHPEVAREYGDLKRRVARTCDNDVERYCDGKDAYVKRVEAMAVKEHASNKELEATR